MRDTIVTVVSTLPAQTFAPSQSPSKTKVAIGPIVGGLVGGIAAGLGLIGLVWWFLHHRKENKEAARRAYVRRRHRQMRQSAKARSQYSGSSIHSGTLLKTPSPTEKSFDASVSFAAPPRTYMKPKEHDPYMSERGYGYEPKIITAPGTEYLVQQRGYDPMRVSPDGFKEQPDVDLFHYQQAQFMLYQQQVQQQQQQQQLSRQSMSSQHRRSVSSNQRKSVSQNRHSSSVTRAKSSPSHSRRKSSPLSSSESSSSSNSSPRVSPPGSPPAMDEVSKRKSRGAARAAAADQAAAKSSAPISNRHRPTRPSPLANQGGRVQSPMMFQSPSVSPSPPELSLNSSERTTPTSSDDSSHAYAAAAQGSWGIALGPVMDTAWDEGGIDFSRGSYYDSASGALPIVDAGPPPREERGERVMSGQYPYDPLAEYHQYIDGLEAGLVADDADNLGSGREPQNPAWI